MSDERRPESGCAAEYIAANDSSVKHTSYREDAKHTFPVEVTNILSQNIYRVDVATSIANYE